MHTFHLDRWLVVRRGLVKGVQVLRKYLLLGEDSFVTRTAFIGPLGIVCV